MLYEIHFMRSFEEAKPRHNLEAQECQLTLQFRLPISQLPITLLNHIVGTIATHCLCYFTPKLHGVAGALTLVLQLIEVISEFDSYLFLTLAKFFLQVGRN